MKVTCKWCWLAIAIRRVSNKTHINPILPPKNLSVLVVIVMHKKPEDIRLTKRSLITLNMFCVILLIYTQTPNIMFCCDKEVTTDPMKRNL